MSEFRGRELKIIIAVFLLSGSFLFFGSVKKVSATLINDYNKPSYDTLQSEEWNNLALDFLNKNGTSTMTGPLGIGTTNPDAPLEVVGTIKATTFSGFLAGGVDAANVLGGGIFGSNWSLLANYSFPASLGIGTSTMLARLAVQGGGGDILNLFDNSAAEKLTVLNSGYVGIGTTTPTEALEVVGNLKLTNQLFSAQPVTFESETSVGLRVTNNYGYVSITPLSSGTAHIYTDRAYFHFNKPIYSTASKFSAYSTGNLQLQTNGTTRIIAMAATGNVGIGTTTPGKLLEVNGQAKFNNFAYGTTPDSTDILALTTVEYVNGKTGGSGGGGSNLWAGTTTGAIWNANGTNNVGIGTTNPGTLLTIANNKWISAVNTAGTGYDNMFKINSSDQIEIGSPLLIGPLELAQDGGFLTFIDMPITSAATIGTVEGYSLRLDGNSLLNLYSTSDGAGGVNNLRVGIGTITPGYLLDVQGGQVNASNGFCISGDCKTAWSQVGGAFWNLNGSNLYASSTGWNVGIGTTTPGKLLDVNGQAIFRNFAYGTTPASTDILALSTVEYVNAKVGGSAGVGTGTSGQTLRHDGTGWIANSTLFNDGTNVGIGTTNPGTKLSVAGVDNKDTGPIIDLAGSSANQTESGRIRFTEVNLQVSPYYQGAFIHFNGLANTLNIGVHNNADSLTANDLNAISIARSTGAVSIGNTALNVLYNGNVGIGTTTPGKLLDVNGQAIFRNFAYGTTPASTDILALSTVEYVNAKVGGSAGVGTGTSGQTLRHNGTGWVANSTLFNDETNVGIGTTNPLQKLDITGGSMRLDNTTGVTPTGIVYKGTDPFISDFNYGNNGTVTTVGNNTFVGIGAGNLTMGSTAIQTYQSSYNTAVGNGALHANTTGYRNTANGHFSLYSNTTGTNNTANGYYSLYSNTIGSNNTANGHYSLYSNTTSNSNTANGYSSLNFNTTGSSNTANGYYSLYSNTTGSNNTANGLQSLYDLGSAQTAGAFNIGTSYTIKTVGTTDFTIIGASANTVGIVFTTNGVGAGTGTAIPNATNNNTALGYNTGRGIIYGTGNTILGANVTGLSAGLTNNIIIADGVGHQRINVDSNGNVGIGTTTPGKLLDVNGQAIFRNFAYGTTPASTDILALSTVEYVNAKVGGSAGVGTGTSGQTLRHDGTGWISDSNLFNTATNVGIGTTNPGARLEVDTSGNTPEILRLYSGQQYADGGGWGLFGGYQSFYGKANSNDTTAKETGRIGFKIMAHSAENGPLTSDLYLGGVNAGSFVEGLRIKSNGNVGIGTTTPESGSKLDVNGNGTIGTQGSARIYLGTIDATNAYIQARDTSINQKLTFYASSYNFSVGNVGIGTTTPGKLLDVNGQAIFRNFAYGTTPASTDILALSTVEYVNAKVGGSAGVGTGTSGQTLRHNGTGWVANSTLFNNGTNVGVGTTNPVSKLSVTTVAYADAPTPATLDLGGAVADNVMGQSEILKMIRSRGANSYAQAASFSLGRYMVSGAEPKTRLDINLRDLVGGGSNAETNVMTLQSNGSVGINITNPLSRLAIKGTGNASTTSALDVQGNDGISHLFVRDDGDVGIGTTSPGAKIDIFGTDNKLRLSYDATKFTDQYTNSSGAYYNVNSTGYYNFGTAGSLNYLYVFGQTANTYFTILGENGLRGTYNGVIKTYINQGGNSYLNGGNVGIGTTTPGKLLDVNGQAIFRNFAYGTTPASTDILALSTVEYVNAKVGGSAGVGTGTSGQTLRHNGTGWVANSTLFNDGTNVGIGTTAPVAKLEIKQPKGPATAGNGNAQSATTMLSLGDNNTNGMLTFGADDNNGGWIQVRNAVSSALYTIQLNPLGGNVIIGGTLAEAKLTVKESTVLGGTTGNYQLLTSIQSSAGSDGNTIRSKVWSLRDATGTGWTTWREHNGIGIDASYGTPLTDKVWWERDPNNNIQSWGDSGNTYMTINTGNVGIGTTTPGKLLDVNGQAIFRNFAYGTTPASTDILALSTVEYVNAKVGGSAGVGTGTSGQTLRHNGTGWVANSTLFNDGTNVGIGTTDPGAKLQIATVDTSVQPAIRLRISSAPTYGIDMDMEQNLTGYFALYSVRAGVRTLGLTQGWGAGNLGNVGINITNPLSRLAIKGTGNASTTSALDVQGNDGISHLFVRDDGNVGIGTTNPEYKLDVNGFSRLGSGAAINSTSGNWIYYPNVVSYSSSNTIVGALVVHTNLNRSSVEIFKMRVIGYGYGSASNIDFTVVGYAYSGANGNVDGLGGAAVNYSIVDNGNDGLTKRIGIDAAGNVAVAVGDATSSFYYYRLAVDYWSTRNSVNASTGWSIDTNAVSGFGWGDLHVLSPAITQLTTGNVGIGTTTPGKLLEVNGQAKFNNFAYGTTPASTDILALSTVEYVNAKVGGSAGVGTGTSGQTLRHNGTGWVANSTLFNDGTNVGIGTASPYTRLSINNNASEYNSANSKISVYADAASTYGIGFGKYTNYGVGIYAGDSFTAAPKVFVESTGNVGIGTTTPSEKLEVNGRVKIGDNTVSGENFTFVDTAPGMKVQNQYGNLNITPLNSGWLHFYTDRSNFIFNKPIYIIGGRLASYSTSDLTLSAGGTDNDLTIINTTGNVGIGTTTPGKLLEVNGQAKFNNFAYGTTPVSTDLLALSTVEYVNGKTGGSGGVGTGTSGQTLRHNGTGWVANSTLFNDGTNVGIGTAAPLAKLHIDSVADASGLMLSTGVDNSNSPYILFADRYGANIGAGIKAIASGGYGKKDLTFYTGKSDSWTSTVSDLTERMRITNSGNVGIGTTTPTNSLHIERTVQNDVASLLVNQTNSTASNPMALIEARAQSTRVSAVRISDSTNYWEWARPYNSGNPITRTTFRYNATEIMTMLNDGNVGIGTTTPGKLLDVNGQAIFRNFAYGTTPVSTDILALATVEYVNGITGGVYLPIAGGTMTGSIAMGNNNISNVNTLTVTKINATTIDPLYSLNGVNYATFAASIAGGVKEECLGKIKINRLAGREYESVINFSDIAQGSDLWVWRQVVDFNSDNVEVSITPYGKFAQVYYLIEGNKLIFRSDRPVEISYRLTGRRFDWRQWPTKPLDQSEKGVKVE